MGAFRDRLRALATALWPFRGDDSRLWVEPENAITRKVTASLRQMQFPALPAPPVHPQIARDPVAASVHASAGATAPVVAAMPAPVTSELDRAVAAAAAAAARVARAPATTRREAPVPTRTARRRSRRAA